MTTSATQTASSTSSNSESVPRVGSNRHRPPRRLAVGAAASIRVSVVDAEGGFALAAEEAGRAEDHHQQEQHEEEHLSERGRDVVAAQRLHDADADSAEQRAFDAAHAAQHDDHERDQHEIESYRRKHR